MNTDIKELGELLTEHEAATLLNISVQKLRKDRWAGKGVKFYKFGSAVRYAEKDLLKYIQSCLRSSTTSAPSKKQGDLS